MKKVKVLVGIPSLRDNDRFASYREDVITHIKNALRDVHYEVYVTPPTSIESWPGVVDCCNLIVDKFLSGSWTHLWLVQADVQVPADAFEKLYNLDVDVAQGVVSGHDDRNRLVCGYMDENMKVWYLPRQAVEGMILSGWVFAGLSCTLIKRRVLEAGIRFRLVPGIGEDVLFLYDVQSRGFIARVHGGVMCGHLPEWPLTTWIEGLQDVRGKFGVLDVGCGHQPKGDVNVDLFLGPTPHRAADQRVCDDVALDARSIANLVRADGCHLPFVDGAFEKAYSSHLIEHMQNPERLLKEMSRVASAVEVRCPHPECPGAMDETKPLHVRSFHPSWFMAKLLELGLRADVRTEYSQGVPFEIVARGEKMNGFGA